MKISKSLAIFFVVALLLCCEIPVTTHQKGMESITAAELKVHLDFLAADEFQGRNTPSKELKIASRYLATMAESYGFKPLLPDGSFYQKIPLEVNTILEDETRIRMITKSDEQVFYFSKAFGLSGRSVPAGKFSGEVIFAGYGLGAPDLGWDDYGDIDLTGKIVLFLDVQLPEDHVLKPKENRRILRRRRYRAREKGASAVLIVVNEEREKNFTQNGHNFDSSEQASLADRLSSIQQTSQQKPFLVADIRHEVALEILGLTKNELRSMFETIKRGQQVPCRKLPGKNLEISVEVKRRKDWTYNVVAYLEGRDPLLKDEYILFGSHHDHVGVREGRIYNGADDNGSGTVAMLEIAQAMIIDKPKRSVIMVWHTGEEKGLWGARYFVEKSPVPVENMSAQLNMDMLCRNDPNSLYLIGSNKISTELDAAIHAVNERFIHLNFDYKYEDPAHPERFFFRSDHYPYIQYGIPAVWFFCGTTEDYHQETDTIDRVDFKKMEKVTRLVYLTSLEIGNKSEMLKLDINPKITSRGKRNLKIKWE